MTAWIVAAFAVGTAVGLLLGAAITVVFSPNPGDTRRRRRRRR